LFDCVQLFVDRTHIAGLVEKPSYQGCEQEEDKAANGDTFYCYAKLAQLVYLSLGNSADLLTPVGIGAFRETVDT